MENGLKSSRVCRLPNEKVAGTSQELGVRENSRDWLSLLMMIGDLESDLNPNNLFLFVSCIFSPRTYSPPTCSSLLSIKFFFN